MSRMVLFGLSLMMMVSACGPGSRELGGDEHSGASAGMDDEQTQAATLAASPPTVGSLPGQAGVAASGAATYRIPIALTPGTAGMQPELVLAYNSQGGEGIAGIGWELSGLSGINRCARTEAQDGRRGGINFDDNDRFCLDGRRLIAIAGAYGKDRTEYRTEIDGFAKIISYGDAGGGPKSFEVRTKAGRTFEYGATNNARVEGQGRSQVLLWMVNKVSDRNGNYYSVTYRDTGAPGEAFPLRVDYTGNADAGLAPYASVRFVYQDNPRMRTSYVAGSPMRNPSHLKALEVYHGESKVRRYELRYVNPPMVPRETSTGGRRVGHTGRRILTEEELKNGSPARWPVTYTRLVGVTQCAKGVCQPETVVTWSDALGNTNFDAPGSGKWAGHGGGAKNNFIGDYDGDGRSDLAGYTGSNSVWHVTLSSGRGFNAPGSGAWTGHGGGIHNNTMGDFNGDGRTDMMAAMSGGQWHVTLSSGTDFNAPGSGAWSGHGGGANNNVVGDFNGDGRTDIAGYTGANGGWHVTLSSGTNFNAAGSGYWSGHGGGANNNIVGDFNGDGMSDIAGYTGANGGWHVTLSSGTNFNAPGSGLWNGVAAAVSSVVTGDFNGDGLTDMATSTSGHEWRVCLSTGRDFACATWSGHDQTIANNVLGDFNGDGLTDLATPGWGSSWWLVCSSTGTNFVCQIRTSLEGTHRELGPADFNGDGKTDLLAHVSGGTWSVSLSKAAMPGRVLSIRNGLGAVAEFGYRPLTDGAVYTKGSSAGARQMDLQAPIYVVSSHSASNGIGGKTTRNYRYAGAVVDLTGRGHLGFASRSVTDVQRGTTTETRYNQPFPYTGAVAHRTVKGADDTVLGRTIFWYGAESTTGTGGKSWFVFQRESLAEYHELDGSLLRTVKTTSRYDDYGNPKEVTRSTSADGGASYPWSVTTYNTYHAAFPDIWLVSRPDRTTVTYRAPDTAPVQRVTQLEYRKGNDAHLVRIKQVVAGTDLGLKTTYGYDKFGNVGTVTAASTNPNEAKRISTTTYDAQGRFPTLLVNAAGHTREPTYDPMLGLETEVVDANGLTTTTTYDPFGRVRQVEHVDGTVSSRSYAWCSDLDDCPPHAVYRVATTHTGLGVRHEYRDQLGRAVQAKTPGLGNKMVFAERQYDALGRTAATSRPFYEGATKHWTRFRYDLRDRVIERSGPAARVPRSTVSYQGLTRVYTDALSKNTTQVFDVLGRLKSVTDHDGGVLRHSYDAAGKLLSATDDAGNVTTMAYDERGNQVSLDDPDTGTWAYEYNAFGELVWQRDAREQVTTFGYDTLGRMTRRSEPEGVATWAYDGAAKAKGQLTEVTSKGYKSTLGYDDFGRLFRTEQEISGQKLTTSVAYSTETGKLITQSYPGANGAFRLRNVYDNNGLLVEVRDDVSDRPYWRADNADAAGQLTKVALGDALVKEMTYEPGTGRVESIITNGGSVQHLVYRYNRVGSLTTRMDHRQRLQERFEYDDLHRLARAHARNTPPGGPSTTIADREYRYDRLGNLTFKSDVGDYTYGGDGAGPHAVTQAGSNAYTYDAKGNMLTGNGRSIRWTSYGKPLVVTSPRGRTISRYDANHNRIFKGGSSGATYYLGKLYERRVRGKVTTHRYFVYAGGEAVAQVERVQNDGVWKPQTTRYLLTDHLGSLDVITNEAGVARQRLSFDAFGKRRRFDWQDARRIRSPFTTRGFTGHEQDDEVGLINMNARLYDPDLGRFISADPIVQFPGNLQSYNRYSYVLGSPLTFTDPSGYGLWSKVKNWANDRGGDLNDWAHKGSDAITNNWVADQLKGLAKNRYFQTAVMAVAAFYACGPQCSVSFASPFAGADGGGSWGESLGQALVRQALPVAAYAWMTWEAFGGDEGAGKVAQFAAENVAPGGGIPAAIADITSGTVSGFGWGAFGMVTELPGFKQIKTVGALMKGAGPVDGVIVLGEGIKSNRAFLQYLKEPPKITGERGREFVFDPDTNLFAVGYPRSIDGSPHERLARALGADESRAVGGTLLPGRGGLMFETTENSGHLGENWWRNPESRKQFRSFMAEQLPGIEHRHWDWPGRM